MKGLELDAVVVDPQAIVDSDATGGRMLFVGLTRTTKHLSVVGAPQDLAQLLDPEHVDREPGRRIGPQHLAADGPGPGATTPGTLDPVGPDEEPEESSHDMDTDGKALRHGEIKVGPVDGQMGRVTEMVARQIASDLGTPTRLRATPSR